jgi:hypothetical protein
MNNFDQAYFIFSFNIWQKMADKVTKISMDIYIGNWRKVEF